MIQLEFIAILLICLPLLIMLAARFFLNSHRQLVHDVLFLSSYVVSIFFSFQCVKLLSEMTLIGESMFSVDVLNVYFSSFTYPLAVNIGWLVIYLYFRLNRKQDIKNTR